MEHASAEKGPRPRYDSANRDRRRAEILAVAIGEMNAWGAQGLVLADVAAKLGMSKANLSYYFRRKEELAGECLNQTLGGYQSMVSRALAQPTARGRLEALFHHFFERLAKVALGEAPPLASLGLLPGLGEPYAGPVLERYRRLLRHTAALFDAPDGPELDQIGRPARAQLVLTQLFWFSTWSDQCDPGDYPRLARRVFAIVADGLAPATMASGLEWSQRSYPPTIEDPDPQRRAFYRAATELINRLGYRGASVERISAAVNLTKGSAYHHHASKEDLVLACAERSFRALWDLARAAGAEAGANGPWPQLVRLVASLIAYQASGQGPFLRASALAALPEGSRERIARQWGRFTHHLAALVSDAQAEGGVRALDPVIAAQVLAAGLNAADEVRRFAPSGAVDVQAHCTFPLLWGVLADDPAVAGRRKLSA